MKILELFSGTESFSKVAKERGHEIFTVDIEPKFNPSLSIDIMKLEPNMIPFEPDVIWASPPCQKFSIMTVYMNWTKEGDNYIPKRKETIEAINIVKKTLELIKKFNPKFWFIENPRAMLRKQDFMPNDKRKTVTYCQYGFDYQKPTDIWTNLNSWNPKPKCSPKSLCHERASRGSRKGIQGDIDKMVERYRTYLQWSPLGLGFTEVRSTIRGIILPKLCEEIIIECEKYA